MEPTGNAGTAADALRKQHVIDPEICIRCNTCEETCPVDSVTHDDNNYVVDADKCNFCLDCISPCPTGAIDNWRVVNAAYSLDDQFGWSELPAQPEVRAGAPDEAADDEAGRLIAEAHRGAGGRSIAPASAAEPRINLYNRQRPAIATVTGTFRLTAPDADNDVRHVILDFGDTAFPVLEGQSIGIVAPGADGSGAPHRVRLYSVASPRDGEKPNANNLALTVKREPNGVCSNYICDLKKGDRVQVTGPFGATFLMPNDPSANILMICTGTGSAPFRAFTERRRRVMRDAPGRMMLFFGARRPEELPYFGPLQKVPEGLLRKHFAYSRVPGQPKVYVQDLMRQKADEVGILLRHPQTHVYLCGLRGMENGVDDALAAIYGNGGAEWAALRAHMRADGRYHLETY
ncbi:MAG: benzoyl-CoA 2,3-epoxidase subunit BoxA [Alphaproteobacteria bacterium]|nr:benzoyl-CoA 2,3-epoxidase subunit BoxA [Alphaproteobacteria bacterium]